MDPRRAQIDKLCNFINSVNHLEPNELALDQKYTLEINNNTEGKDECGYTTRELKLMIGDITEINYADLKFLISKNMYYTIKKFLKPELVKPELLNNCKFLSIAKLLNVKPNSNKPLKFAEKINNQPLVDYYREFRSVTSREQLVEGCDLDASRFVCDDLTMDELNIAVKLGYKLRPTVLNEVKLLMPNSKIFDKLVEENNIEIVREIIDMVKDKKFDLYDEDNDNLSDEMMQLMLEHGFKMNYLSATYLSHNKVCLLLKYGYKLLSWDIPKHYKAYVECGVINVDVIDSIIKANDVETFNTINVGLDFTNYKYKLDKGSDLDMLHAVIRKGYNIHSFDKSYKKTILHEAIKTRNEDIVKFLVDSGMDMTHLDYKGKSYYDAASKFPEILALLPARNA